MIPSDFCNGVFQVRQKPTFKKEYFCDKHEKQQQQCAPERRCKQAMGHTPEGVCL